MILVLVDREQLDQLISTAHDATDQAPLASDDPIVTLAVQAGLPIPGPMLPGSLPPAPPLINDKLSNVCATTFRHPNDARLRCAEDGKVVYTSMGQAEHAAERISGRQPMQAYLGRCGHYHVSRIKGDRRHASR
jgi:hypothetical protein